jgi:DNA topoisomerase-1
LNALLPTDDEAEIKKNIINVLDQVSEKLGNSRTICKKYYVHPGLFTLYEEKKLDDFIKGGKPVKGAGLEKLLLQVLKKCL